MKLFVKYIVILILEDNTEVRANCGKGEGAWTELPAVRALGVPGLT